MNEWCHAMKLKTNFSLPHVSDNEWIKSHVVTETSGVVSGWRSL